METSSTVDIYIVDTGVQLNHPEFEGRAIKGVEILGAGTGDVSGHGTHVAGTTAGKSYGIARTARVISVKVLGDDGSGTSSSVIQGLQWVKADHQANPSRKAVVNMSVGGGKSQATNDAVKELYDAGVVVVVAAGNDNSNACNYSPSSATEAVTVACSTSTDGFCSFSNYGSCVDIIAPGKDIKSAKPGSSYATLSGTSMSSPHVAGAVANFLGCNTAATPAQVATWLSNKASNCKISSPSSGTPNKLLHYSCSDQVDPDIYDCATGSGLFGLSAAT